MKRAIAFVYVIGLFLLGGVIGALGMHLYHDQRPERPPRGERGGPPPMRRGLPPSFMLLEGRENLDWLELTDDQRDEVREILETGRREIGALREELRPKIEERARELRERLDAVLTPEQQAKLADHMEQQGRRRPRRGPPRP